MGYPVIRIIIMRGRAGSRKRGVGVEEVGGGQLAPTVESVYSMCFGGSGGGGGAAAVAGVKAMGRKTGLGSSSGSNYSPAAAAGSASRDHQQSHPYAADARQDVVCRGPTGRHNSIDNHGFRFPSLRAPQ